MTDAYPTQPLSRNRQRVLVKFTNLDDVEDFVNQGISRGWWPLFIVPIVFHNELKPQLMVVWRIANLDVPPAPR